MDVAAIWRLTVRRGRDTCVVRGSERHYCSRACSRELLTLMNRFLQRAVAVVAAQSRAARTLVGLQSEQYCSPRSGAAAVARMVS